MFISKKDFDALCERVERLEAEEAWRIEERRRSIKKLRARVKRLEAQSECCGTQTTVEGSPCTDAETGAETAGRMTWEEYERSMQRQFENMLAYDGSDQTARGDE